MSHSHTSHVSTMICSAGWNIPVLRDPTRFSAALADSRCWLLGETLSKQFLQAVCRLMLSAQNEEFRVASEAGAQGGRLTADLTVARWDAALEPQISLAI